MDASSQTPLPFATFPRATFLCENCGHDHDVLDALLMLPGVCSWCYDSGPDHDADWAESLRTR